MARKAAENGPRREIWAGNLTRLPDSLYHLTNVMMSAVYNLWMTWKPTRASKRTLILGQPIAIIIIGIITIAP